MTVNLVLVLVAGALCGCGVAMLLERSLTRVVMGVVVLSNGVNVLILASGRSGGPPIVGVTRPEDMSDPLSQAMVLTAIVITLGVTAFLLAMSYRSWQYSGHDEVQDDIEDRRITRAALRGETPTEEEPGEEPRASDFDPARVALRHGEEGDVW